MNDVSRHQLEITIFQFKFQISVFKNEKKHTHQIRLPLIQYAAFAKRYMSQILGISNITKINVK